MGKLDDILETVGTYGHLPIGLIVFLVGALIYKIKGLDASFVTFSTSILGFLGGHMYIQSNGNGNGSSNGSPTNDNPTTPPSPPIMPTTPPTQH